MELRVLKYFLMVAREENIKEGVPGSLHHTAHAFPAADPVGGRTGSSAFSPGKIPCDADK